nr:ABC transporter substrate-binding protein [Lachnospiraceae bacterium]
MKKSVKRFLAMLAAGAMCVLPLAGCSSGANYTKDNTEYVIGLSGPLTGPAAIYGTAVKNSVEMAVEEINALGGINGTMFKVIVTDDQHDATKIATNYASLLEDGMQVSLGTVTTG